MESITMEYIGLEEKTGAFCKRYKGYASFDAMPKASQSTYIKGTNSRLRTLASAKYNIPIMRKEDGTKYSKQLTEQKEALQYHYKNHERLEELDSKVEELIEIMESMEREDKQRLSVEPTTWLSQEMYHNDSTIDMKPYSFSDTYPKDTQAIMSLR